MCQYLIFFSLCCKTIAINPSSEIWFLPVSIRTNFWMAPPKFAQTVNAIRFLCVTPSVLFCLQPMCIKVNMLLLSWIASRFTVDFISLFSQIWLKFLFWFISLIKNDVLAMPSHGLLFLRCIVLRRHKILIYVLNVKCRCIDFILQHKIALDKLWPAI